MKKRYVLSLISLVIPIVYWSVILYHSFNSFENMVLDQINEAEITSIEIQRSLSEEQVIIDDKKEIETIIHKFADVKLRRSDASDHSKESYWISIFVNKGMRFGMRLTDENFIYINDLYKKDKYSSGSFIITSDFDGAFIANLFK